MQIPLSFEISNHKGKNAWWLKGNFLSQKRQKLGLWLGEIVL